MSELKVKRLPLDAKYFEANGKKYHVTDRLSVERWRYFEDFQALVGFGRSFDDIFQNVKKAYEKLQDPKIADASVILHNILIGVKEKLDNRHHPALMLCALFVNSEGENEKVYDEEIMNTKIADWQKEGYDINDFFQLAWNLVPGFIEHYKEDLQSISSHTKGTKPKASKDKK
jgi:hypothetical protein